MVSPNLRVKSVRKAFDEIAGEWDDYRREPSGAARLLLRGARGGRAMDAGCGNGRNALLVAKRFKRVDAFDFSPRMVEKARGNLRGTGVRVAVADVQKLPYADGVFDAAFYFAVLHHLKRRELRKALSEAWRVLREGGLLRVSVWNRERPAAEGASEKIVEWRKRTGKRVKRFHAFYSEREWREMLEENGFKNIKVFYESKGARVPAEGSRNLCLTAKKVGKWKS